MLWAPATPLTAVLAACIPLIFTPRFYFYDDTQIGAYPIWIDIGRKLLAGQWPLFSTTGWQAGNYAAEGQWGIISPITLGIGLGSVFAPNAVVFATAVKIAFLAIASLGVYLLCRSFHIARPLAFVAGVAATMAGFTVYLDSASWVTGLMVWAFLPYTWWAARKLALKGQSPVALLISGYLLITIGYVHGTIMLCIVLAAVLTEAVFRRGWRGILSLFAAGALLGLVALAVYLPGVLTLDSTARQTVIANSNYLTVDLSGIAGSALSTGAPQIASWWWGPFAPAPLTYVAWFLPAIVFVNFRRLGRFLRLVPSLGIFLALSLTLTLAPSDMGPLRSPMRILPYVSLGLIVLFAFALSHARTRRPTRGRWIALGATAGISGYLGWEGSPEHWKADGVAGILMIAGLVAIGLTIQHAKLAKQVLPRIAVIAIIVSCASALVQHHYLPVPPVQDFKMPANVSFYGGQLSPAKGEAIVVGSPSAFDGAAWQETLVGNMWYVANASVHNLYTPIQNAAYSQDLCMGSRGETCRELLDKLFQPDGKNGKLLVDLLSIDTVQIIRDPSDEDSTKIMSLAPPHGWSVASRGTYTVLWTRDHPLANVGAPVAATGGANVAVKNTDEYGSDFRVQNIPPQGTDVTLSRLAWPGYSSTQGSIGDPLRGYLLTVHVPQTAEGKAISVSFRPPGWTVEIGALAVAFIAGTLWCTISTLRRRATTRRSRHERTALGIA